MIEVDQNTTHAPQDEDTSKRRQILDGAREVFMELGFDGASMGEIARAAGVSKGTLYVYFTDKTALFEAIVEEETRTAVLFSFDPDRDIATNLTGFGEAYIALVCRPGGGSAIRTVMAIAERMPDVGRRYYDRVLEGTINCLTTYLRGRVEAGQLAIDDCQLAASQFHLMCQATLFLPFIFQAEPAPSPERISKVVASAVRMFLANYGVKG
ncbi:MULTISPECIES: TetR/AcrR family transcriptional regulator [Bradyrhizobium]|jgi:AcrR family transcriptional regulator|uniref:TetR/AcrR family transcriptional regulator n=1 Tax=Bradyrhizobium denitrificans TaxID=2734912 RepID=A0ABS5GEA6_9BRAD|nr:MULTISPECIES: TetR/AcrR family transcriptional regulator [Bradyrhizobium]RTL96391.1 MAG: TetR/AcrR family transcriptional regulator [Bradyrhizobiaceae bacterium]MBR1139670.1 TetR/AcrR family transcriptional regulator [Bradyrhizobium denitrificans]MCL8484068.1 TetR/AcrR family transcriptional regulator [Bradyrhizobium denitrificans]MDU0960367.1 TetR/AcrR family transcriptional regulator [Bradyrhizobium sp.]MDU1491331.1 TetR/AcrR family transcriptional regulator [Bradyrhizobium sp.]